MMRGRGTQYCARCGSAKATAHSKRTLAVWCVACVTVIVERSQKSGVPFKEALAREEYATSARAKADKKRRATLARKRRAALVAKRADAAARKPRWTKTGKLRLPDPELLCPSR